MSKSKREKAILDLTNDKLVELDAGLKALGSMEGDTTLMWQVEDILERIQIPIKRVQRERERILRKYAKVDEAGQPVRVMDERGRIAYAVPLEARPLANDELEKYMEQDTEEEIIFPASWLLPAEKLPTRCTRDILHGIKPVVVRKVDSDHEEESEEASDKGEKESE